jgi:hypothetical protein
MSDTFQVSQSKLERWRKCRYSYHLRYNEKLRPKSKGRPLYFGSLVHSMIDAEANGRDPFSVLDEIPLEELRMFQSEKEEYGNLIEDVRHIMTDYFDFWEKNPLEYVPVGRRYTEHEFKVEVSPGILCTGKIDAIANSNQLRWLVEHKTHKHIPNENQRWRNLQSAIYIRIIDMLGWEPVDGTCWDYIRSKSPSYPQVLKNGQLSKRGIDSLPSRVFDTLERLRISPKKASHLIESVMRNRKYYFQRVFTPTKPKLVDSVFRDFVETAKEMRELSEKVKAKTIGRHCEWCEFEPICRAELTGADADFVKKARFTQESKDEKTSKKIGSERVLPRRPPGWPDKAPSERVPLRSKRKRKDHLSRERPEAPTLSRREG